MAQTNFTPILLYASSTPTNVPTAGNLTNSATGSEIAINVADKNLFFKDSGGVVNTVPIRQSSTSSNGWLSNTDWNTFNSKAPATSGTSLLYGNGSGGFSNVTIGPGISFAGGTLSATGTGGTVTSVTGTAPVSVATGTTTPVISMAAANTTTNGYLTSTDWNTFNNKTSNLGTVTSVAALTLGTTGTDLSSTVANSTTTPVITLNVPTASATNRGALSAADWSTFNGKAPGVTFTSNYVPYGQGTTTLNQSANLTFDGTFLYASGGFKVSSTAAPAFKATMSATQTISNNTETKVIFDNETFDTSSNYDTTNYRFTPTVAGYYNVGANICFTGTATREYYLNTQIRKNGSSSSYNNTIMSFKLGTGGDSAVFNSTLISMNGTTDYLEIYVYTYDFTATSSIDVNRFFSQFYATFVRSL